MRKQYISILLIVVGVVSLSYLFLTKEVTTEVVPVEEVPVVLTQTYTLDDVKTHKNIDDCWQVINEIVYDFTPYIESADHPGGKAMAKDCGTDSTFRYENDPKHSEYAESLLPEYAIGKLVINE